MGSSSVHLFYLQSHHLVLRKFKEGFYFSQLQSIPHQPQSFNSTKAGLFLLENKQGEIGGLFI